MLTGEYRHQLEAIVESDDERITPRDRIEAMKLLSTSATTADTAVMAMAAELDLDRTGVGAGAAGVLRAGGG